mmetsp:Transcript_6674/g.11896  ORF Transcript_6674/g.11896 Transcript_6674/m.11896 type:complete len:203 (-) Transcript_6674:55-663(-)
MALSRASTLAAKDARQIRPSVVLSSARPSKRASTPATLASSLRISFFVSAKAAGPVTAPAPKSSVPAFRTSDNVRSTMRAISDCITAFSSRIAIRCRHVRQVSPPRPSSRSTVACCCRKSESSNEATRSPILASRLSLCLARASSTSRALGKRLISVVMCRFSLCNRERLCLKSVSGPCEARTSSTWRRHAWSSLFNTFISS